MDTNIVENTFTERNRFIETADKVAIDQWLDKMDSDYAAGSPTISDEVYDRLIQTYESRFGKRVKVGSRPTHSAVQLPIAMMSLDKVMKDKELGKYCEKNPGSYVVMDKINGNAGLYEIKYSGKTPQISLYNRGDGTEGSDLSHILAYLKLPVLPFDIHIKGELVINKKDYEPFKEDYRTNLSMINGLLNSKSADPERLKLFRFIAYDMSFPKNQDISLPILETLKHLVKYGFTIPFNYVIDDKKINVQWLSKVYRSRKRDASYDVDGIVIVNNRPIEYRERLIRENPKYAIAFKEYGETAEATVSHVLWEASKNHLLKPVVKIHPVKIGEFTIKSLTAFNAGWISQNGVGPGTKLLITHNTIPYILGVIKSSEAQMPPEELYPRDSWEWNETRVDIRLLEENDEIKIAKIYEFFKQIGAKYLGEKTLKKFYQAGFDTIKLMLETTKEEFMDATIEGVGEGIIDRIIESIRVSLPSVTLPQLMSASGAFGLGFGSRKLTLVVNTYPNIMEMDPEPEDIESINGFAQKTAERFVEGLPRFKEFVQDIPILQQLLKGELKPLLKKESVETVVAPEIQTDGKESIKGKSVVFTGFRDKKLEGQITERGGSVKTGVSKKTDYLIVGGKKGQGSGKEKKAIGYGIPILNLTEFRSMFGF